MIDDQHPRPLALWRLALMPSMGAAIGSFLWWYQLDLLRSVGVGFIVYCGLCALVFADGLYLVLTKNRAERARHRAAQSAYNLFMRSVSGETVVPTELPGMQRRSMIIRPANKPPHEVVWWAPLDPLERGVRERLVLVCYWAWALQRPSDSISGLESEVMVGDNCAFSRPADWVEASNALRDIGVVSKPGQGYKTVWAPDWTPRKAIAFIQSGVPLPLNYKKLRIAVRPRPATRPTGPETPSDVPGQGGL